MKNRIALHEEKSRPLPMGALKKLRCVLMVLAFPAYTMAQPSSMPDGSLFFEEYTVDEQVRYLIPDTTEIDALTEWDWIEMKPINEVRKHLKLINLDLEITEEIEIIQNRENESWEHDIGWITVGKENTVVENQSGEQITSLPHSDKYLANLNTIKQTITQRGLTPPLPFPVYEELPLEELQNEGFSVSETSGGYTISDGYKEVTINPDEQTSVTQLLGLEYEVPYYSYEAFQISSQGYRVRTFKKTKTRLLSENGWCVVRVTTEAFLNHELYYDQEMIFEEEEGEGIASDFILYPIPTDSDFHIEYTGTTYSNTDYSIAVITPLGETLYQQESLNTGTAELINISALQDGHYLIQFTMADGVEFVKNLFKN